MRKVDKRISRTRELLQKALIELIREHGYDAITIQEIADRANVGRTTFYLHYNSKEELFLSCHEAMIREFRITQLHPLSREEFLSPDAPMGLKLAYNHINESRLLLYSVFQINVLLRQLRDWNALQIEANLRAVFAEGESSIPLDVLSSYLGGAQITLLHWWLEKRRPHTLEDLAAFHLLRRAAIREAFGLQ